MFRNDDRFKNELKHECELPQEEDIVVKYITSGYCVKLRRKIRHLLLLSETTSKSKVYLKSSFVIQRERNHHLKYHYYMIHPFSKFRILWETFMMFVLLMLLMLIPTSVVFKNKTLKIIKVSLDFVSIVDIIITFNTGYQNTKTNKIVMHRGHVAKHYIFGWFLCDVISSFPYEMIYSFFNTDLKYPQIRYISFLKLFRVATFIKYMDQFRDHKQYSIFKFKVLKLVLIVFLLFIWSTSLVYITTMIKVKKISREEKERMLLLTCLRKVVYMLLLFGSPEPSTNITDILIEIFCLSIGFTVHLLVISQILQIVTKYSSSSNKYYQMTQQVEEFMRYKNLSYSIRKKILGYFDFRFQQNYYKEGDILRMLSPQLRQEMLVHIHLHLLERAHIFDDIPMSVLCKIIYHMKPEIYLPADVVVTAGSVGDCMFFLASGTVAVYTAAGKEVCHLSDGANFGEIALIMDNEHRVATVVAIDCCEIFILNRKDFTRQLERFPEVYNRLKKITQDRVRRTVMASITGDDVSEVGSEGDSVMTWSKKPDTHHSVWNHANV